MSESVNSSKSDIDIRNLRETMQADLDNNKALQFA